MPDTLHIRARDARGQVVDVARLSRGSITIGSATHNALVLPGDDVAPAQLRADWDGTSRSVTLTNIGVDGVSVGNLQLQPHASLSWDGSQPLRVGPYSLKLVGATEAPSTETQTTNTTSTPRWPIALALVLMAAALGVLIFSLLSRPAEIVSFALNDDGAQRQVQFRVRNAQRVELRVNGQLANASQMRFDTSSGEGAYAPNPNDSAFELVAYNAINQPTRGQLTMAIVVVPTPTLIPTPNPTATPLPGDPFVAEFAFNGLNKANELSDVLLNKGEGLVVSWDVANVDGVELQPAGTFGAKDSVRVAPQETTVYTLVARNAFGEAKRSVKVVVMDAQATANVNATAATNAKGTQDALVASQAQSAGTATAAARATATTIALVLADAQLRATQAAAEATATAGAQATALAFGTAQAGATQQVRDASGATATAIVLGTAQSDTARFSRFNGTWVNSAPINDGVVRLVIDNVGATITVQTFVKCQLQPQTQECPWGLKAQTYTDEPFLVRYDFGDGSARTLLLERAGESLQVQDVDSRGPVWVYTLAKQ